MVKESKEKESTETKIQVNTNSKAFQEGLILAMKIRVVQETGGKRQ